MNRATPSSRDVVAELTVTRGVDGRLAFDGATADDARVVVGGIRYPNTEQSAVAVVDTASGESFFAEGWFAGWADQTGATYPAS